MAARRKTVRRAVKRKTTARKRVVKRKTARKTTARTKKTIFN